MGDLHAAGAIAVRDIESDIEMLLGQVVLADLRAYRGGTPEKVRVLEANCPGCQPPQDTEQLDFFAAVACWRQAQRIDRLPAIGFETDHEQGWKGSAEFFNDDALTLRKQDRLILVGNRIACAFGRDGNTADARCSKLDIIGGSCGAD
ncbi:hypothetical protein GCM10007937_52600 [Mesorhizobium albiziae]|nr:hypothetical protein GCM10007937_52600 [Mesorhizobium albiziae]